MVEAFFQGALRPELRSMLEASLVRAGSVIVRQTVLNDAVLTFQTGFTTYALMGLLADNNFTLKVGTGFTTAMTVDNTNGKVSFPAGIKQLHVGTTAPVSPAVGDLWVDTN